MNNNLALADNQTNILWSRYGEILRILDSTNVSMEYLTEVLKRPNYKARFRLFVLNPDETVNYEIPEEDIILNSGSFTENYQNGQRKSVNVNLVNTDGKYTPNINSIWVHSKFRFDVGIEFSGGVYWFPRGIYILNNPDSTHNRSDKQVSLNLVDKFAILEGKAGTLEATYEVPVGSEIKSVIGDILTLDNGSGMAIDLKPIIYDSVFEGAIMPYTLSKDAGSTLGEMLLEIGTILNAEIYYNSQGNLCVVNINETTLDVQKSALWDYSDDDKDYFSAVMNYDFENCVNEIHVVGDNVDNAIFSAMSQNNNPLSSLCIAKIGRRIEYINDSDIYSDDLAQQRADYELRKYSILKTMINISVSFNPLLFVNNLLVITDSYYGIERERFLIQSITYNIGTDCKMSVSCSNIVNFSNIEEPQSYIETTYTRRVIVGDDLSNKVLHFDFPDNIGEIIMNFPYVRVDSADAISIESEETNSSNVVTTNKFIVQEKITRPLSQQNYATVYYTHNTGSSWETTPIYNDDKINQENNIKLSSLKMDENTGVVSGTLDQYDMSESIYEYIFIEDEFIRPVKTGDYLKGAKLYFTFPRSVYNYIIDNDYNDGFINDSNGGYLFSASCDSNEVIIGCFGVDSQQTDSYLNLYKYTRGQFGSLDTNLSVFEYDDSTFNILEIVGEITNSDLAKYVLVDTRTILEYTEFSTQSTYNVGDVVLYNNDFYRCARAVTTPGEWTGIYNVEYKNIEVGDDLTNQTLVFDWPTTWPGGGAGTIIEASAYKEIAYQQVKGNQVYLRLPERDDVFLAKYKSGSLIEHLDTCYTYDFGIVTYVAKSAQQLYEAIKLKEETGNWEYIDSVSVINE